MITTASGLVFEQTSEIRFPMSSERRMKMLWPLEMVIDDVLFWMRCWDRFEQKDKAFTHIYDNGSDALMKAQGRRG